MNGKLYVYFHIHIALEQYLPEKATTFIRDFNNVAITTEDYSLACFDMPWACLWYANFENGITQSPYSILVDNKERSIVIAVEYNGDFLS